MDRWAWEAIVHGVAKSWTQLKQLSLHTTRWIRLITNSSGKMESLKLKWNHLKGGSKKKGGEERINRINSNCSKNDGLILKTFKVTLYTSIKTCAKLLQLCLTLCNSMDCSPPGSSVHGILQARILEWVAVVSSRGPSPPRDQTHVSCVSCIGRRVLYHQPTWEAQLRNKNYQFGF